MPNVCKFENYNKIEDTIYSLGKGVSLKMMVYLYKNLEKMGRKSFYQEVQYFSEKDEEHLINIKRSFDYIAVIEKQAFNGNMKEQIYIRQQDIFLLRPLLNSIYTVFTDDAKFSSTFRKRNGKLIVNKGVPIELSGLVAGKFLIFENSKEVQANGDELPAIKMYLGDYNSFVIMNQSKFGGLIECINNMDMFQYGQNMLNFFRRPEFGTNLYDVNSHQPSTMMNKTHFNR